MDPKEQEYERVRQALQEPTPPPTNPDGSEGKARYMPHDVVAACDLAVEDDIVQRVRKAASLPHPESVPVEIASEDIAHVLGQLDAGLAQYRERQEAIRFAQSPAGIRAHLEGQPVAPAARAAAGDTLPRGEKPDFSKVPEGEPRAPQTPQGTPQSQPPTHGQPRRR